MMALSFLHKYLTRLVYNHIIFGHRHHYDQYSAPKQSYPILAASSLNVPLKPVASGPSEHRREVTKLSALTVNH